MDYFRIYNNEVRVTFDQAKREKTLMERGLDFADAMTVFEGTTIEVEDTRRDYGERRIVSYGLLAGRIGVGQPAAGQRQRRRAVGWVAGDACGSC